MLGALIGKLPAVGMASKSGLLLKCNLGGHLAQRQARLDLDDIVWSFSFFNHQVPKTGACFSRGATEGLRVYRWSAIRYTFRKVAIRFCVSFWAGVTAETSMSCVFAFCVCASLVCVCAERLIYPGANHLSRRRICVPCSSCNRAWRLISKLCQRSFGNQGG